MYKAITAYRNQLREKLFSIPEKVPTRHRRYVIASNFMFVFALVGHSAFIPVHWILGAPLLFTVNLLCVPMDALCLFLNHRRHYTAAFGIWVTGVTYHASISSLAYGWESGFHYYILSLTVFVFIAPWRKLVNILLLCILMGIYIWLNTHGRMSPPDIMLTPTLKTAANVINIVVNFIVLGYLANYYTLAAEKTQNALEENEKTLKTTLAASPVGIALIKNREIFWTNETLSQMMGYGKNEPIERDARRFLPNVGDLEQFEHLAHEVGQPSIDVPDTRLIRRDKTTFPCHIKIRPIAPGDTTRGSIVVVMDMTEQKAAEREKAALRARFQRAEKMEMVGTLAGGVAHDLNNILSGILSYPELLLMDLTPENPMRKPLETIRQSGEKAAAIVQDLLTLARRGVPAQQVTDMNAIVQEYLASPEQAKLAHYHPTVRFDTRLIPGLFKVSGSPVHLAKTVMNLISNASEAISGGGTVTIETENRRIIIAYSGYEIIEPGEYAVLSVSDDGQGIPAESLDRIFEPFYTKKVMGRSGTGLGLAVVWGTVKDNGGYVDVSSVPGRGTRFDLYFPRTDQVALEKDADSLENHPGNGEHVLVVDDVEEQRIIATGMLKKLGYRADAVDSGKTALAWMRSHRSDLLMLDMIMDPGIDGLETYRQVLKDHPGQKAIVASGYSETQRVSAVLDLGASGYLKKPYTLFELAKAVGDALKEPSE
ncbi:ATP-binding protein [uncultured Desulfosarcina sp.]|uniref:hybrid sensor histidine kinase/response regulator n=1 Tax=uncultured Desulfosarcina sp. TaxID=218289 RepID=UPI0029C81F73|nr:ATP-binding protein [uncultured Desulfosarcina sp.]